MFQVCLWLYSLINNPMHENIGIDVLSSVRLRYLRLQTIAESGFTDEDDAASKQAKRHSQKDTVHVELSPTTGHITQIQMYLQPYQTP